MEYMMNQEANNEALKLIARSIEMLQDCETPVIDVRDLLKQAVDKLAQ
jgi:hypothetical protein